MRRFKSQIFKWITGGCALVGCGLLVLIASAIIFRGFPALSWQFFTEQIRLVGASGGIFYNLVGTFILIVTALLFSAPIAMGLALVQGVYVRSPRRRERLMLMLYLLNGVPSILFGIFGLIVFVKFFGLGKSWVSGGVLLGLLILPTVTIALIERIASLPGKYVEAAAGLGLTQSQIIWSVILPQSVSGLVTGSLLGIARDR